MSKNYLRKNRIAGQFAARTIAMLESPAFQVLSLAGHRVLARIEIEFAHHGGNDNGRLPVTFNHFAEYGMDRHAIGPALREVCALGFVEITEQGRAGNAEWRRPNKFRLTYKHAGRADPTDEWRRITTVEEAVMIAQRARAPHQTKNKTPVGVSANFQCGNPHRKPDFHGGKTHTTGHGVKTPTTSKISGKPRSGRASSSLASQHAGQGSPGRYVLFADPRAMQQFYDVGKGRYVAPPAWHDGDAGDGSRCHLADCRYVAPTAAF